MLGQVSATLAMLSGLGLIAIGLTGSGRAEAGQVNSLIAAAGFGIWMLSVSVSVLGVIWLQ